jgi:4-alpha-glucanotransferase
VYAAWHTSIVSTNGSGVDEWGITDGFHDIDGGWHSTTEPVRNALRAAMGDPQSGDPLWFVHPGDEHELWNPCRLVLEDGDDRGVVHRLPNDVPLGYHDLVPVYGGPVTRVICAPRSCPAAPTGWGVACQLYSLHSAGTQGIGDVADLATLASWVESLGGNVILLSPLHAPAPTPHQEPSPYSPASRQWRNPLHLRVDGVDPFHGPRIDRDVVWSRKRAALHAEWSEAERNGGEDVEWADWTREMGASLSTWSRWCAGVERSPDDAPFHAWLQWKIDEQLALVRRVAPRVSLVGDLAIGFDPTGADAAAFAPVLAEGCRVGAPPDAFNAAGQDWGLPPFVPWKLRAARYEPFIATIRGALRGLQGLRMDHVMGLFRQYWIPPDTPPTGGAYVRFPAEELLSIVALEATRAGAFVIGEDLGTVETGVRETLDRFGILGTTVAWFTDDRPSVYPARSLATITTHDLPTLMGVWHGTDGDDVLRDRLVTLTNATLGDRDEDVAVAAHAALGRAPSVVKLATLDDLCLATERPNVPGTVDEKPNWRLPLPLSLEQMTVSPVARASLVALSTATLPNA